MKKLFLNFIFLATLITPIFGVAQQIQLGPSNVQVKGILQQANGGFGSNPNIPTNCNSASDALNWNNSTNQFGCNVFVSSMSASSSYMFTFNVSNPTTTPALTVSFGNVLNQIYIGTGNGAGAWETIPDCRNSNNAIGFNNSTQSLVCNTISTADTPNSLTGNSSGGASPGTTFNGSSAVTFDYHTVGAPSATGTGASGTWGINISGNAATASAFATTPSLCNPSSNFAYGIAANGNAECNPLPTITVYYQTVQSNGTGLTQAPILNFDSTLNVVNGTGKSTVGLPSIATAGSYVNPSSVTIDAEGRVTTVVAGGSPLQTNCLTTACANGTVYSGGSGGITYTNHYTYVVTEEVTMSGPGEGAAGCDYLLSSTVDGMTGPSASITNDSYGYQSITFKVIPSATFSVSTSQISGGGGCGVFPGITNWLEVQ